MKISSIGPALLRRDEMVEAHLPLVRAIAHQLARTLPACFDLDDLIATGNLALTQAASRWRESEGVTFGAYARHRVRGAILDSVKGRKYEEATRPGISHVIEFPASASTAESAIDERRSEQRVADAIAQLPPRLRKVVTLYSADDAQRSAIAGVLGVCERRVNQLRAQAIVEIRKNLERAA